MIRLRTGRLRGSIVIEPSKSMMQRAVAAAALAGGESVLRNISMCDDCAAGMGAAKALGAKIDGPVDGSVVIRGGIEDSPKELYCGEAGLCIRMYTPIASLLSSRVVLTGSGGLRTRPVSMVEEPLAKLGVEAVTNGGFLPITVRGPLEGGELTLDASLSSQFLTGLLLALPLARNDSVVNVSSLSSKPYIDMTLQVMDAFGIEYFRDGYRQFVIPGGQEYVSRDFTIEGDWSGASFPLAAGALGGPVTVRGLSMKSKQADIAIMDVLGLVGARIEASGEDVTVSRGELRAFEFDATECPDLFPPLAALAGHCSGVSEIKGISRLRHKESDRASVLKEQFGRLGVDITLKDDIMYISGGRGNGGTVSACGDHRIAMAAAVYAGGLEDDTVEIDGHECVAKSWPEFFERFAELGLERR